MTLHFLPGSCEAPLAFESCLTELKIRNSGGDGEIRISLHLVQAALYMVFTVLGNYYLMHAHVFLPIFVFFYSLASSFNLLLVLSQSNKHLGRI